MFNRRLWHLNLGLFIILIGAAVIFVTSFPLNIWGMVLAIIAGVSCFTLTLVFYFIEESEDRKAMTKSAWLTMFLAALIILTYGIFYPISHNNTAVPSAIGCNSIFPIIILIVASIILIKQKRGQD